MGRELTSIEHIDLSYTCHCMDPCFPGVLDALYAVTTITSLDFSGSQGLMDHGLLALPRMTGLRRLRLARVSELTDATLFIVSSECFMFYCLLSFLLCCFPSQSATSYLNVSVAPPSKELRNDDCCCCSLLQTHTNWLSVPHAHANPGNDVHNRI